MSRFLALRMGATIGLALLLSAWLYLAHPSWFNTNSVFQLPIVDHSTPTVGVFAATPVTSPTAVPIIPSIGATQHLDDIWITPLHLSHSQGAHGALPNVGDEFLLIRLTIYNRSQIDFQVRLNDFQILDSQGELSFPLTLDFTRTHLREVRLIPHGHTEGTLLFEAPLPHRVVTLIYQPDTLDPSKHKEWVLR